MGYNTQLAERVRAVLSKGPGVTERTMFGGLSFMVNDNMAVGVLNNDLVVRVGPDHYEDALRRPGARPMDFTGRPMKGFVYVSGDGLDGASLSEWVALGSAFAESAGRK